MSHITQRTGCCPCTGVPSNPCNIDNIARSGEMLGTNINSHVRTLCWTGFLETPIFLKLLVWYSLDMLTAAIELMRALNVTCVHRRRWYSRDNHGRHLILRYARRPGIWIDYENSNICGRFLADRCTWISTEPMGRQSLPRGLRIV